MIKIDSNEEFSWDGQVWTLNRVDSKVVLKKIREAGKIKIHHPPSVKEVIDYFKSKGYPEELAIKFHDFYTDETNPSAQWKDSNGKLVKDWRKKAKSQWFKEDNKMRSTPNNQMIR